MTGSEKGICLPGSGQQITVQPAQGEIAQRLAVGVGAEVAVFPQPALAVHDAVGRGDVHSAVHHFQVSGQERTGLGPEAIPATQSVGGGVPVALFVDGVKRAAVGGEPVELRIDRLPALAVVGTARQAPATAIYVVQYQQGIARCRKPDQGVKKTGLEIPGGAAVGRVVEEMIGAHPDPRSADDTVVQGLVAGRK